MRNLFPYGVLGLHLTCEVSKAKSMYNLLTLYKMLWSVMHVTLTVVVLGTAWSELSYT